MHLGPPDRTRRRAAAPQSTQIMVEQHRRNLHRRPRGSHLCIEAAAAGDPRADRLRLHSSLSLPCLAARHAAAPDRHRPLQIRRVQAEREDQARPQSGLLEKRTALSRRHRIHDHPQPFDRDPRFHRRQVRLDFSIRGDGPAIAGGEATGAAGDLRPRTGQCQHQSPRQPRGLALRLSRSAARIGTALDRKSFIDILAEGQGDIGGAMLPPPAGVWGMPADILATIPGYGPDIAKNRAAAREIMTKLGYGPDKRLAINVSARNIPAYRDPAIILIDQLKEIWIDGELDAVETANWFPKLARKDYQIGLNNTGSGVDDPDQQFFENYGCGSERNYTSYCNTELERLFVEQSTIADREKRRHLVWEIDKKLQEDGARPIIYHTRAATCMQPQLKGLTVMVNSQYNGWRMEDVWLDR